MAEPSSPGERSGILVRYFIVPNGTATGVRSGWHSGSLEATRTSIAHTWSGRSSMANRLVTRMACWPAGRLMLVNDCAASTEFGVMRRPSLVSRCTARQLTSATRPVPLSVSIQSPSRKGCSKSISSPEMIWPTEFCSVRPITIEVTPSAVNKPPTLAPQM